MKLNLILLFTITLFLTSCQMDVEDYEKLVENPELMHQSLQKLTDVIVHDIFSPPVASRVYVYPNIAAYEVIRFKDSTMKSFVGQLNELDSLPLPPADQDISFDLAALQAFYKVGKQLIFSEDSLANFQSKFLDDLRGKGFPKKVMENSVAFGDEMANAILAWANTDNYKETRSYPKFTIDNKPNTWKPTPPAYMAGIEPHWREIRPMVLDSSNQFIPKEPTPFDMDKDSKFYAEVMEVYDVVKEIGDEAVEIARFWDCNPYVMNQKGHVMFATKKITPGGHWMGIVKIACEKSQSSMQESIRAYALTSIALFDGFISCWDEKYRSSLIRPETVINEYIDEGWLPVLQTPPFPEHTSGHSVISTAAAKVLTSIFGDDFSFKDDVEVQYGLPERSFDSFMEAAQEAAISRLYGGIHYRPAIEYGVEQGNLIGDFIVQKINLYN